MRNINELIGIIKGINYDGVVNRFEVAKLSSWIKKNKNLSYDAKQVRLISLIEQVIEDGIITDDERMMLIDYCNKYTDTITASSVKIYELNGIIEGIICDNEINEKEVYRLREWMKTNSSYIRGHKPSELICEKIDSILEDDIVTNEEQKALLDMLTKRIADTQLETKIEHLKNCVKEKKNIGIDLIDLLDNMDAIGIIHNRAERELNKTLNTYSVTYIQDPEIVFISLVLIGMLYYDGAFYESVKKTYKHLYQRYSEQKIEGLIRTILSRYRTKEENNGSKTRIINIALAGSIVPSYFLGSFFEFIYDIYKLNFNNDLPKNLYEEFQFVYDGLQSAMRSEGDEIQLNVTKKTYKLIKSTKQLIANPDYNDAVIKLSIIIVRIIDKYIWRKDINLYNPYLKRGYEQWRSTLKKENERGHYNKTDQLRSCWKPEFILKGNTIYLETPIHRVKSSYDYRDIRVIVKNGNKTVYENQSPDMREIIGGYQIKNKSIKISSPLNEVKYMLLAGDKVIYDSKDKLYREFIVFDSDGNELSNNKDYSGTAIFCTKTPVEKSCEYYNDNYFTLSTYNAHIGDAILVNNKVFNFSEMVKAGVFGEKHERYFIGLDGKRFEVFKEEPILVFESEFTNGKFEIQINNYLYKIDKFTHSVIERKGVNKYSVKLKGLSSGIYELRVNVINLGKRSTILRTQFAIDRNLIVEQVEDSKDSYIVSVASDLLEQPIIDEIIIDDFKEDWLTFEWKGTAYTYYIPFDFQLYRINDGKWRPFSEEIWIGDISQNSTIDFYGGGYKSVKLLTCAGQIIDETPKLKDERTYSRLSAGFLLSYKSSFDYIEIMLLVEERYYAGIFCYNKCVLDKNKTTVFYNQKDKALVVTPYFYGTGNVHFKIIDNNDNEVYKSSALKKGIEEYVYDLTSFIDYKVVFFEKEKGLSLKKEHVLQEIPTVFYAIEDFVGKSFKIKEVYFDQYIKGELLRKKYYFNTTYVYFSKMVSSDYFVGKLYVKTRSGVFMLNNLNPVDVQICSDVIDGITELSLTKDGDGLLLDFEHHGIMNSMDDDSAVDIYSCNIDMKEVESV